MKQLIKLVLFLGIVAPSASSGMEDLKEILKDRRAAQGHGSEDDHSENASPQDSLLSRPSEDVGSDVAEALSKMQAQNSASSANDGLMCAAPAFLAKAQRSTPQLRHDDRIESPVPDEEWGDNIRTSPQESPRALPKKPNSEEDLRVSRILAAYENEPAPQAPSDDVPLIEEMPEPVDDAPFAAARDNLTPEQRAATDFTQPVLPESRGVREEINHAAPRPRVQFAPKARLKPFNPNRPPAQATEQTSITAHIKQETNAPLPPLRRIKKPADQPSANPGMRPQTPMRAELKPATLNGTNLLICSGIFGMLTWLQNNTLAQQMPQSRAHAAAKECASLAQQAAAAHALQQLVPGKPANSLAFTAVFTILHACEIGLKKLTESALTKTKAGKKINAAYKKMPAKKRKILDTAGTVTGWLIKTLLARAIAN